MEAAAVDGIGTGGAGIGGAGIGGAGIDGMGIDEAGIKWAGGDGAGTCVAVLVSGTFWVIATSRGSSAPLSPAISEYVGENATTTAQVRHKATPVAASKERFDGPDGGVARKVGSGMTDMAGRGAAGLAPTASAFVGRAADA